MIRNFTALFLCALLAASAVAAPPSSKLPAPATTAMNNLDADRMRAHVRFLSSDFMEGRGTGQRGGDLAAEYIATQFALAKLQPAGDNGAFLQKVPMVGITTVDGTSVQLKPGNEAAIELNLREDIVAMDETQAERTTVEAPIVFVGYGIEAPEYGWNDYKDVDVRGKVLLMLVNEPPTDDKLFKGKAMTYYGRWTYKFEQAARKGAAGALIIHRTEMASYGWNVVQTSWSGERSYLREDGEPKLKLAAWISGDTATRLAATMGTDVDSMIQRANSKDFRPVEIPARVQAEIVSKVRPFESSNVIAKIPGSDPKLKNEAVFFTSHYDHLGMRPGVPGDNIYNGAVDNATGIGMLLEMARAFQSAPQKPGRSLVFAAVTGEEQGLLGSEYLGKNPPVPAAQIALGLNVDGVAPLGIPEEIEVTGSERTSFYPVVEQMAQQFGMKIVPDSNPGAGYFYRSDHFSLARVGVPAFSVGQGDKFAGVERSVTERWGKEYTAKHYHQPSDEFDPKWDFRGNARLAQLVVALGWQAATAPSAVSWNAGDEFEAARKKAQGAAK